MYIWGIKTGDGWIRRTRVGRILIRLSITSIESEELKEEGELFGSYRLLGCDVDEDVSFRVTSPE